MTKQTIQNNPIKPFLGFFQDKTKTVLAGLVKAGLALMITASALTTQSNAQTLTFGGTPPPVLTSNLFVGANYTGIYTNLQFKASLSAPLDPANPITFVFSGVPAGVTINCAANGVVTNTVTTNLLVSVANVTAGNYSVVMTAQTNGVQIGTGSMTFNIVAGNLWTNLSVSTVNWSSANSWTLGVPGVSHEVLFQDHGAMNPATNYVDASTVIGSLSYVRAQGQTTNFLTIADGATLAIAGTNGFSVNQDTLLVPVSNKGMTIRVAGGGGARLVVTNQAARYAVNGTSTGAVGPNSGTSLIMTNLDSQFVSVERVGFGDATLMDRGAVYAEMVWVDLPKTNVFIAAYSNTFWGIDFTNSIQMFNQYDAGSSSFSSGSPMMVNMGISNIFMADSMRVGGNANQGQSVFRFGRDFTNTGVAPVAVFRSPTGGRMSFFGVAIQSGYSGNSRFTRANVQFNHGIVDMMVDTMWLGANRTNDSSASGSGNACTGNLTIGGTADSARPSVVDVNTLVAGNQVWTNNCFAVGNINVWTNAILTVNNYLELGHTTGDLVPGNAAKSGGVLTIIGGVARINQVKLGVESTNNQIVINSAGRLILSNNIAGPTKFLSTLNVNNARINLRVVNGATNICVTNFVTGPNATVINIDALTGFSPTVPATNIIIAYKDSFASHNLSIGSLPSGFNNITLVDNLTDKTIELRIATNAPATLRWRGSENSNWDHTSLNWQNADTLATTRFFDGDRVIFDDAGGVPTTISVVDVINPGQIGTGILVSNSVNAFTFANGGGSIGNSALQKVGTSSLAIDANSTVSIQLDNGVITGSGTFAGGTVSSAGVISFGGTVNGPLVVAGKGTLVSGGIVANSLQIQSGGIFTNIGSIQGGALTLDGGAFLYNATGGLLANIGNVNAINVASNATLINVGNIGSEGQANSLTVNGTFKDLGVGDIYLTQMTINGGGTFLPGGDGIGTTEIKSSLVGATFNGRLLLQPNSTTVIKVDFANAQTNTRVAAQFTDFGGSSAVKNFNGCTVLMTNINTGAGSFALAQSFRAFFGPSGGDIGSTGTGTNTYPASIIPVIPAANTKWDLNQLRDTSPNGILAITSFPTTGTNVVSSFYKDGGNIVTYLSWPSEYIGWKIQQQTNALSVGLKTNWVTINATATTNEFYITNDAAIPATFFRMTYP